MYNIRFWILYTIVLLFACFIVYGICYLIGANQSYLEVIVICCIYNVTTNILSWSVDR